MRKKKVRVETWFSTTIDAVIVGLLVEGGWSAKGIRDELLLRREGKAREKVPQAPEISAFCSHTISVRKQAHKWDKRVVVPSPLLQGFAKGESGTILRQQSFL